MRRPPFIGIGTGRSGTKSLAGIIQSCANTEVTHEQYISRWYEHDPILTELHEELEAKSETVLRGEVACQLLPHVPWLRMNIDDLHVICMHRAKDAVVESHAKKIRPNLRPFDKYKNFPTDSIWTGRYPLIDAADSVQAFEFWWEMYEKMMRGVTPPVLHVNVEDLDSDAELDRIFDFLSIPKEDRAYPNTRNWSEKDWFDLKGIESDARTDF